MDTAPLFFLSNHYSKLERAVQSQVVKLMNLNLTTWVHAISFLGIVNYL